MALERLSRAQKARLMVRVLAAEPNRKPVALIVQEIVTLAYRDRGMAGVRAYFMNMLYKQRAGPAANYLGNRARRRIRHRLGKPPDPDLDDKVRFYARARRAELPIPQLLGTIYPDGIELDGETRPRSNARTIVTVLNEARTIAAHGSIFVKPSDGNSGQDCFRIDPNTGPHAVEEVARRLRSGVFVIQETLVQHPDIARVSPNAVGCLRVHTYRENGESRVLSTTMRFALGNKVIDTPAKDGSTFASVDQRTGQVILPARTHFQLGAREYERHPVTHAALGITLPNWPRVIELAHRAARSFEKPFVGWDLAFSRDGPRLIEGNSTPDLLWVQIAAGGLRSHPEFWPVVEPMLQQA